MAIGISSKKPNNPIFRVKHKAIAEAVAKAGSAVNYGASAIASASVIAEAVQSSIGSVAVGSSSSVIAEAVQLAPTWSNQFDGGGSSVICEAVFVDDSFNLGGGLDLMDEGILVMARATHIDIVGADAQVVADGTGVKIFHPPAAIPSHWNTVDGTNNNTVANVTTSNRYVAAPTVESVPFYTGGGVPWGGDGSTHPCTRTSPLAWSAGPCYFDNTSTTFSVTVTNSTGTIASHSLININGDASSTLNNITITISGWAVVGLGYQATIAVSLDVATLLLNSGYFDILMRHNSGGTNYDKVQ